MRDRARFVAPIPAGATVTRARPLDGHYGAATGKRAPSSRAGRLREVHADRPVGGERAPRGRMGRSRAGRQRPLRPGAGPRAGATASAAELSDTTSWTHASGHAEFVATVVPEFARPGAGLSDALRPRARRRPPRRGRAVAGAGHDAWRRTSHADLDPRARPVGPTTARTRSRGSACTQGSSTSRSTTWRWTSPRPTRCCRLAWGSTRPRRRSPSWRPVRGMGGRYPPRRAARSGRRRVGHGPPRTASGDDELRRRLPPRRVDRAAPPDDLTFLREVACLERCTGRDVRRDPRPPGLGRRSPAAPPQRVPLLPLDQRDEWFKMHPLLARWLSADLEGRRPRSGGPGHPRGGPPAWWSDRGDIDLAFEHTMAAGDFAAGEALVGAHGAHVLHPWHVLHGAAVAGDLPARARPVVGAAVRGRLAGRALPRRRRPGVAVVRETRAHRRARGRRPTSRPTRPACRACALARRSSRPRHEPSSRWPSTPAGTSTAGRGTASRTSRSADCSSSTATTGPRGRSPRAPSRRSSPSHRCSSRTARRPERSCPSSAVPPSEPAERRVRARSLLLEVHAELVPTTALVTAMHALTEARDGRRDAAAEAVELARHKLGGSRASARGSTSWLGCPSSAPAC